MFEPCLNPELVQDHYHGNQCHWEGGVMKMRNIALRVRVKPTSHAFRATIWTLTPPKIPDVTILPPSTCLCSSLPERSVQTTTVLWCNLLLWFIVELGLCRLAVAGYSWISWWLMLESSLDAPALMSIYRLTATSVGKCGNKAFWYSATMMAFLQILYVRGHTEGKILILFLFKTMIFTNIWFYISNLDTGALTYRFMLRSHGPGELDKIFTHTGVPVNVNPI